MIKTTDEIKQELAGIADYMHNEDEWNYSIDIDGIEILAEDAEDDIVYEMAVMKKISSKFFVKTPNPEGIDFECWADTRKEAEEFLEKHKAKEE
jgi:hypothetical protein